MDNNIDVLLNIKLYSLRRNHLKDLTLQQLKDVIYHTKWLVYVPSSVSKIAADINSITINDIANYYADKEKLEDFDLDSELIGSNEI